LHVSYAARAIQERGPEQMFLTDNSINEEIKKIVSHYGGLYPKNRSDIEDIVQTIFCSALRPVFTGISPSYIKTSINNRIVSLNRLHSGKGERVSPDALLGHSAPRETVLDVRRAIDTSHTSEGENLMRLYFIEGMDTTEIAAMLGKSRQAIHARLGRQTKRARKLLGDYEQNFSN